VSERRDGIRPQIGLMLSCGEPPTGGRNYPRKLDYVRAKPGALGQYTEATEKFASVYGDRPRAVDVLFVSDLIVENLDVRPLVFGTSGLKARGVENLAGYPPDEFQDKLRSYDWDLITYPDDQPEPGRYRVNGREDKVVTKLGLKVYGSLYVSIPSVLGVMLVAQISTTSARTMSNWYDGLHRAHRLTGGVLVGIPFKLMLRPARGRYFDAKERKRKTTDFYEWVLDSLHTMSELYEIAAERREAIGAGRPVLALESGRSEEPDEQARTAAAAEPPFVDVREFEELIDGEASEVADDDAGSLFKIPESARQAS
jgi:hypothetical protein